MYFGRGDIFEAISFEHVYVYSSVDLTNDSTGSNLATAVRAAGPVSEKDESTFSLITWNIDGLDLTNVQERARGVCSYIAL